MAEARLCILVTGFEPFGGSALNPSQVIAESIGARLSDRVDAFELRTALLAVDLHRKRVT